MPDFEMSKAIPAKVVVTATAQWAEHGMAQTGTRLIRIGFDLDEAAPNGRTQDTVDLYISSPGGRKVARGALKALGIDFEKIPAYDFDTDDGLTKLIGGKRCRLTYIEEQKENGARRWRATWINSLMTKPKKGESAFEMLKAEKGGQKKDEETETLPLEQQLDEEDVPF